MRKNRYVVFYTIRGFSNTSMTPGGRFNLGAIYYLMYWPCEFGLNRRRLHLCFLFAPRWEERGGRKDILPALMEAHR